MDMRTGEIAPQEVFRQRGVNPKYLRPIGIQIGDDNPGLMKPIDPANLSQRVRNMVATTGRGMVSRNSKCPCGSQ